MNPGPAVLVSEHPLYGGQGPAFLGYPGGSAGFFMDPNGAIFNASISGTTMTVYQLLNGFLQVGQTVQGVAPGTVITGLGTGQGGATTALAAGTYTVSVSQTVAQQNLQTTSAAQPQPFGNAQAALLRGQAAGVVATYSTTQTPSAVSANTTNEQAMTVQSGTGASMLLASGDLVYVNKPTSQAGLGVGNVRISASNTLQLNFSNYTGGSITPTASEVYSIVAMRGIPSMSLTLSPAAVPANSTVEQQFTVVPATTGANAGVGLPPGQLVQVMKPTSQAGLNIVGCRVVSNNVLGITFSNVTAAAITPTAAEVYTAWAMGGLDALNNSVFYGFNVGTVGAIGAGTVISGGATTLTGMLATDVITGMFKPTPQAAATNVATLLYGIPTANTLTLYFLGTGTGATPTASEVYGIHSVRLNPVAPLVLYAAALTPVSVAANTTAEQTFTITGLVSGTPIWVNKPSATSGLGIAGVRVSATNTLAINYANSSAAAIVPPAETYIVGNFQVPSPGAGNCVYQAIAASQNNAANLLQAMRNAIGPATAGGLNMIAGG